MRESKAYQQIMEEGALTTRRADILRVLQARFGPKAAAEFETPLNALDDLDRLGHLVDLVARCATLKELRDALGAIAAHP
jgi:hypothetical protein